MRVLNGAEAMNERGERMNNWDNSRIDLDKELEKTETNGTNRLVVPKKSNSSEKNTSRQPSKDSQQPDIDNRSDKSTRYANIDRGLVYEAKLVQCHKVTGPVRMPSKESSTGESASRALPMSAAKRAPLPGENVLTRF